MSGAVINDANFDGIPDNLQTFLTQSDFRLDWSRRRKVIFYTLAAIGLIFFMNSLVVFWCILTGKALDAQLAGLSTSLMWVLSTVFMAVIAAYLGASQIDVNGFRSSVTEMVNKMVEVRK